MSVTAKLFTHAGGQAVRLPDAFQFEGTEVRVSKVGDKVILEPTGPRRMPWTLIDATGDKPFMAEGRDQPHWPPDRGSVPPTARRTRPAR
jgi:antitoxin VapB